MASFRTFTIDGSDETATARTLQLGDQFTIQAFVANSSSFFSSGSAGISFNASTSNSAFTDYVTGSRLIFQINQGGNWFGNPLTISGFPTPGSDATFTFKLITPDRIRVTMQGGGPTNTSTYDVELNGSSGAAIQSFAIWNQTSGNSNDMFWKNASLTATGSLELGSSNSSYTVSSVLTDGLAADSNSTTNANSLTKEGSGTVTLTANNTYTGSTTVSAGTLVLEGNLANSAVTVQSGATLQISSNATVSSLTVNDGGQVTVDAGVTLTISNDLTLNSGASLDVEETGSVTVTGNAIFDRNLANHEQWYLMSSPVNGEEYNDAWNTLNSIDQGTGNNRGVSWYDNSSSDPTTGHWRYLQATSSGTFNVGQGYAIRRATSGGDIEFTGSGIYSSDQVFALTQGANNFNLVGNPFTGSLNLGDFFTDNGAGVISGSQVWFWNGSSYDVRTSVAHASQEIAPGQGFFVEAAAETNLTFDIADVSHTAASFVRNSSFPEISLTLTKGADVRNSYVYYMDGSTTEYDLGYDGHLFGGANHSLAIYSQMVSNDQGYKFQLQVLPNSDYENMVIPVGVIAEAGKITFSAEATNLPAGYKVFLEDKETGNFIRLDEPGSEYTVDLASASNDIGRFFLHTKTSALSTGDIELSNVSAYLSGTNNLRVLGIQNGTTQVRLFNILGKQVLNTSFEASGVNDVVLPNLRQGVYIVQVASELGTINKKIVIE